MPVRSLNDVFGLGNAPVAGSIGQAQAQTQDTARLVGYDPGANVLPAWPFAAQHRTNVVNFTVELHDGGYLVRQEGRSTICTTIESVQKLLAAAIGAAALTITK